MANQEIDEITIKDNDNVKIFEGLAHSEIIKNPQLLQILELNAEQLTYYLENFILDNPFINLEYSIEQVIPAFDKYEQSQRIKDIQKNSQSLDTYLFEQILLYRQTEIRDAMIKLIDFLDDRGYLPYTVNELAKKIQTDEVVTLDALTLFQQLEPAGIGAYDLKDCLMIQTDRDEYAPKQAYIILKDYFQELLEEDYVEIEKQSGYTRDSIQEAVNYYHMLRRSPAVLFDKVDKLNLIPDISVVPSGKGISIRYNRQYYPKITFDADYYLEMESRDDKELATYIGPHQDSYKVLANNLRLREQLILEVVRVIIQNQSDFFYNKITDLKPLSIHDVSISVRLPEQLISRIVTNKNIEFNNYVYPITDFINVSLAKTREGLSANYLKDMIADIIKDLGKDISNQEIVELLAEKQIIVGEPIVNNYRKNLE